MVWQLAGDGWLSTASLESRAVCVSYREVVRLLAGDVAAPRQAGPHIFQLMARAQLPGRLAQWLYYCTVFAKGVPSSTIAHWAIILRPIHPSTPLLFASTSYKQIFPGGISGGMSASPSQMARLQPLHR